MADRLELRRVSVLDVQPGPSGVKLVPSGGFAVCFVCDFALQPGLLCCEPAIGSGLWDTLGCCVRFGTSRSRVNNQHVMVHAAERRTQSLPLTRRARGIN
jgi:hypothetical protein